MALEATIQKSPNLPVYYIVCFITLWYCICTRFNSLKRGLPENPFKLEG